MLVELAVPELDDQISQNEATTMSYLDDGSSANFEHFRLQRRARLRGSP